MTDILILRTREAFDKALAVVKTTAHETETRQVKDGHIVRHREPAFGSLVAGLWKKSRFEIGYAVLAREPATTRRAAAIEALAP